MRSLVEAFRLVWILCEARVGTAVAIVPGAEAGEETDR